MLFYIVLRKVYYSAVYSYNAPHLCPVSGSYGNLVTSPHCVYITFSKKLQRGLESISYTASILVCFSVLVGNLSHAWLYVSVYISHSSFVLGKIMQFFVFMIV